MFVTLAATIAFNAICSTRLLLDILCSYYAAANASSTDDSSLLEAPQNFLDLSSRSVINANGTERREWIYELRQIQFAGFE